MTAAAQMRFDPLPVIPENAPITLQAHGRFVVWRAFESGKQDGKAAKIPVDIVSGRKVSAFDPAHQFTFDEAVEAHENGAGDGIGIVLNGEPIGKDEDGADLYLVGIDLDQVTIDDAAQAAAMSIVAEVGSYAEQSPSGRGLRIFCLSRHCPRSGQTRFGELYADRRFLTVTGHRINSREVVESTDAVRAIERRWWGEPAIVKADVIPFPIETLELNRRICGDWVETDDNVAEVRDLLAWVPPDAHYETWRDVVWAVASLGWNCGAELVEDWSSGSAAHWDNDDGAGATRAIESLLEGFDPSRGISIGTLFYHAHANGMPRPERPVAPLFPTAPMQAAEGSTGGFRLLSRDELDALPPLRWTVRGVLPETGLAAIYGEPGSGKSFLALDLAARISSGAAMWFGHEVRRREVVYVALEGGRGIQQRLAAWDDLNGSRAAVLKVVLQPLQLLDPMQAEAIASAIAQQCSSGAVVFIDTFAQATAGADENSAQDMGAALSAAQAIASAVGGLVVLVHHSGKDASRGLRGHSALNAAMDAVLAVERDRQTGRRTWRVTKMKDAEDGAVGHFDLQRVDLGPDEFGGRVTSCAVREVDGVAAAVASLAPRGENQRKVLDAVRAHYSWGEALSRDAVVEIAKTALADVPSRHRATRAKDAVEALMDGGLLVLDDGGITPLNPPSPTTGSPPPSPP
jgi:hypothetical protein